MSRENVALLHRWFEEVWNKGRPEAIDEMLDPDGIVHGLGEAGVEVRGAVGFVPFFARFRGTFPDINITIEDTIAEGDKVAARWTARMTHEGDGLDFAPTGRAVTITGMSIIRVADGRIAEAWNNWDIASLLQQINAPGDTRLLD